MIKKSQFSLKTYSPLKHVSRIPSRIVTSTVLTISRCNDDRLHLQCNRNQRLISRLHKVFDYLPRYYYIIPEIWFGM